MRVTNSMQQRQVAQNIARIMRTFTGAQGEASSGKRVQRVSDDPLGARSILAANDEIRGITQYRRNIRSARVRQDAAESVLVQLTDLLARARELSVGQNTAIANAQTRAAAGIEVERLLEQAVALLNSRVEGEFIFAGSLSTTLPFTVTGSTVTYDGDGVARQLQLDDGGVIGLPPTGQAVGPGSGLLEAFVAARDALMADSQSGVAAGLGQLETAFERVQTMLAEVGATQRTFEVAEARLTAREATVDEQRRAFEDADLAQAAIRMTAAQNALEAAYATTGRLLNLNLTDYLR